MSRRMSRCRRFDRLAVLLLCGSLTACAGVMRVPARSRGPGGAQLQNAQLDMSFLESGSIHRKEVVDRLAQIDAGSRDPRLFWGRWVHSKWGVWWLAVAPGAAGSGDAKRIWHTRNLLITFGEDGLMQSKQIIDSDRVLWRELHASVILLPPLDLSQPEYLVFRSNRTYPIILTRDYLEVEHEQKAPIRIFPDKIKRLSHELMGNNQEIAGTTCHSLHLSEKSALGKTIRFCGGGSEVVTIFKYLNQAAPKTMKWE